MWVISGIGFILLCLYARMFLAYMHAWKNMHEAKSAHPGFTGFSILVPFRNEEKSLPSLLSCFEQLETDGIPFELILIDDHSEDASPEIIRQWLQHKTWATLQLNEGEGKKHAIQTGIKRAKYDFVVCTDADVYFGKEWLTTIARYASPEVQLLSGPVRLVGKTGFFHRWQELEFAGLIAIGAASIQLNRPNMCNGANLAYRKSAFFEVNGFSDNAHLLSGDDEFLMHKIYARYGKDAVRFIKDPKAMVYTDTKASLKDFLSQRSRWSSKATQYKDRRVTFDLFIAYFSALFALFGLLLLPFSLNWAMPGLVFLAGKTMLEYRFFGLILPFFKQEKQRKAFLVSELFQIVYVVVIGVLGTFVKFEWKGRKQ